MSSEGSVHTSISGVRQFGFYRTIDARTEEFLRLSRKRQIRQGCACAAISTAITVTVVISIIFIYEYNSTIHDSNTKTRMTQKWLSLMNETPEAIPFESKLNKARINLDPKYLEFIPLILKTLKNNKYFDKNLEEDSTQTPLIDKHEKPEDFYTKNIFSDSRNWMRIPASRSYTIEYKTSPIIYFKYPTRNVDHFTKIRKIRDYQRVMKYVDKMINNRAGNPSSTIPMLKNTNSFYKGSTSSTTPKSKVKYDHKKLNSLKNTSTNIRKNTKCPCTKKLNRLLVKLINSLQKLVPDFIGSQQINLCNETSYKTNKTVTKNLEYTSPTIKFEGITKTDQSSEILDIIALDFNNNSLNTVKPPNYTKEFVPVSNSLEVPNIWRTSTPTNDLTSTPSTIKKTFDLLNPNLDYTLSTMIKLITNNINSTQQDIKDTSHTTTKQAIEGTDAIYYFPEITTKPMSKEPYLTIKPSFTVPTVRDLILQKSMHVTVKPLIVSSKGYEDYSSSPKVMSKCSGLNKLNKELAKNKMLVTKSNEKNRKLVTGSDNGHNKKLSSHSILHEIEKENYNNTWNILKNLGKLAHSTTMFQSRSHESALKSIERTSTEVVKKEESVDFITGPHEMSVQSFLRKIHAELMPEDVTLEDEVDIVSSEEIPEQDVKIFGNLQRKINGSKFLRKTKMETPRFGHELKEIGQQTNVFYNNFQSMLPENRPTYLEIHRNNWMKHDDQHMEYDNTINFLE